MSNSHHAYIHNLTPLRGFAALWVAAYHFRMSMPGFARYDITKVLSKGYMMVDLFFIMSGFIILHVYGDDFSRQLAKGNVKKYFIARFARTYPLHFFTLGLLIVMTWISGHWSIVNDPAAIPTNLLLLQSFGIHQLSTWNRLSWSLSAEWASYVVFPLLSISFNQSKRLTLMLIPILILATYISLLYFLPPKGIGNAQRLILHQLDVTYDYGFLRGLAGFTLGMLCYEFYFNAHYRELFSSDLAAVIFISMTFLYMYENVNDLLLIPALSGLTLCFASNCGRLHKYCSLTVLQLIGKVSYSIYLIQWFIATLFASLLALPALKEALPPLETASFLAGTLYEITYLLLLISFSCLTYYGIEKPFRNYINRATQRRPPTHPAKSNLPSPSTLLSENPRSHS